MLYDNSMLNQKPLITDVKMLKYVFSAFSEEELRSKKGLSQ
jgi:hypothetical protein